MSFQHLVLMDVVLVNALLLTPMQMIQQGDAIMNALILNGDWQQQENVRQIVPRIIIKILLKSYVINAIQTVLHAQREMRIIAEVVLERVLNHITIILV